jgi:hypothetical protein
MNQHKILTNDLKSAHKTMMEFKMEFEELYYQWRVDRLHFVQPSIHSILHIAPEVIRVGPPICSSQWTMERTIGNLGEEIHQPSNPYTNLSLRGLLRAQVNALKVMIPDLEPANALPQGAVDIGNGYVLLRALERSRSPVWDCEREAMRLFGLDLGLNMTYSIARWARLRLPTGQTARSQ